MSLSYFNMATGEIIWDMESRTVLKLAQDNVINQTR